MLTDERYKQLMNDVGLPNSRSLLQALKQCAMEAALSERALLAKAMPIPKQESVSEGKYKAHDWWRVEVTLYDGTLLAIEPEMLAGKSDLTGRDEETIRAAGRHLLSFIGDPQPAQAAAIPERWHENEFIGPAPTGYKDWNEWMLSPVKLFARIEAREETFPKPE